MERLVLVLLFAGLGSAEDTQQARTRTRVPVGVGAWEKHGSPLVRRVSSLLLGAPRRVGRVIVLPLYARAPAEARRANATVWVRGSGAAREVCEGRRFYLRISNKGDRPLLVPAGAVYAGGGVDMAVRNDAIVSAAFSAVVSARRSKDAEPAGQTRVRRFVGLLPPGMVAGSLVERGKAPPWNGALRAAGFVGARREKSVVALLLGLELSCHVLATAFNRTAVGAVFLVDGRPIAAHVFDTNDLFVDGMADVLLSVALEARYATRRSATRGSARVRALAFLRASLGVDAQRRESSGEGHELKLYEAGRDFVGHAVLDRHGRVVHFGLYALGNGSPSSRPPSQPPDGPGGDTPGAATRKPRPTVAEERLRGRKPQGAVGGDSGRGG